MDYDKLTDTLRQHGVSCVRAYGRYCSICDEAVTALSTLQAENEKLRSDLRRLQTERDTLLAANQHLLAEREQLTAERDAAVSDIENALAYGLKDCELCVNVQCYVRGGTKPCLPKWRGPKKED